jgi:malate dehydrogenase (oxaloacetate-decarboxylating)(NADP+)
MPIDRQDALDYHSSGRRGKIAVIPTKPALTQRDLSLAYSPGVAEPCREIHRDPEEVFKYTARGNLVAVVSNGTAVLSSSPARALRRSPRPSTTWRSGCGARTSSWRTARGSSTASARTR